MFYFPQITLLITHYNRSKSLENLLATFLALNCVFGEIVVSDDGSRDEHLSYIESTLKEKYTFKLVKAEKNSGLGNNMNKGQDAVTLPYTLYVQEDFEPQAGFPEALMSASQYLDDDRSIDMARFYAYQPYPYKKPFNSDSRFSMLFIPKLALKYFKIYYYSDHPHLRRSNFFEKFGRYREGIKGDRTEYWMCVSMIQHKGKSLFYNEFDKLFLQKNSSEEPITMVRKKWTNSQNPLVSGLRIAYRQIRYNYDILFSKGRNT